MGFIVFYYDDWRLGTQVDRGCNLSELLSKSLTSPLWPEQATLSCNRSIVYHLNFDMHTLQ